MADTISITVNGTAHVLTRINNDNFSNEYYKRLDTGDFRLLTRHSSDKVKAGETPRERHTITLIENVFPSGTTPATSRQVSTTIVASAYDTFAAQKAVALGLSAYLTAANIEALIGKQV